MTETPQQPEQQPEPVEGSLQDEAVAAAEAAATAPDGSAATGVPEGQVGAETEVEAPLDPAVPESPGDRLVLAERLAEERLADLQRTQAEFINYKRRTERDRDVVVQNAKFSALAPIVEVLDNIDRAREHGEVEGGFKSVAEQLERVVAAAGLVKYGEPGDAFDPTRHDALSHLGTDPEVTVTTCKVVAKAGYAIGERVVRAAQVLVVDPE
ncbi:nucleotide exchange factor GrpE [Nocardioides litoris]|uniref:nucleotide exchange factor GrpE n=1 Tax=Nocardioides litoris TaxID=1926648 RepID=UPI001FEA9DF6|nr:nucleotide exchange factor GrpE [Nocardioides litoris]